MKRILSLLMVLVTIAFSFPTLALSEKNIPADAWYAPYAQRMVREVSCDSFIPNREMSKEEFVSRAVQLLLPETGDPMAEAFSYELINEPEFPRDSWGKPVTRQEMVRVAVRAAETILHEEKATDTESFTSQISDWAATCDFCKPYVSQAYAKGIISGLPDGSFQGTRNATCAEAVVVLTRLIDPSYRIQHVSGTAFNPKNDVLPDGRMKLEKAKEFLSLTLDHLLFYQENGRFYVKGNLPKLPDSFKNWLYISVDFNENARMKPIVFNTHSQQQERLIPSEGEFVREIPGMTDASQVSIVRIQTAVDAPDADCEAVGGEYKVTGVMLFNTTLLGQVRLLEFDDVAKTATTTILPFECTEIFVWGNAQ